MAADPILVDLHYVMDTGQELDILNFHKSFPITCKARVERISPDGVMLRVQPPGSILLEKQDSTIVLSRGLPEAVKAKIIEFDLISGKLVLIDFGYVGAHFGERMIARVQPDSNMPVEIELGEDGYTGELVDVSLSGVGVQAPEGVFQRGQVIQVTLPLPEGRVTLPGKILNLSTPSLAHQRLSIAFTRNAQEIAVIMRYIKDRRTEILTEIDQMYKKVYEEKVAQADPGSQ